MSQAAPSREDLEKILAEIESLKTEAAGYGEQEALSRNALTEFKLAQEGLGALMTSKEGQETLIPLGGRVFMKAKVDPSDCVLVGIGRGVSVEKSHKEALGWVEERYEELDKGHDQIVTKLRELEARMAELNQMAQAVYMELQNQMAKEQQGE